MKILSFILLLSFQSIHSQSIKAIFDAIVKSDQVYLESNFAATVEFAYNQDIQSLDHKAAAKKLIELVSLPGTRNYKISHESITKGKSSSMGIGSLTIGSQKFRIYITYTIEAGKNLISDIKIEKDEL